LSQGGYSSSSSLSPIVHVLLWPSAAAVQAVADVEHPERETAAEINFDLYFFKVYS
jgi:hypothetical protein